MVGILVHGGAGTITGEARRQLSADGCDTAAREGYELLKSGASAVEAVKKAVEIMENLPQFNAGYGSVITEDQTVEMDAMLVDGATGSLGGVMGVSRIKNPILLCDTIRKESKHILFAGQGAEKFAEKHGYELINPEELITDRVRERYHNWIKRRENDSVDPEGRDKYGTVGAVAIDNQGRLAAATSTGGTLGKVVGRIGDTPLFGAGTYADQEIAVSATGVGEYIIQGMVGIEIGYRAKQTDLYSAVKEVLDVTNERFGPLGVIVINAAGELAFHKTTKDLAYSFMNDSGNGNFLDNE
ncbi:MAG: isoaspartyl peptidase/L-asparaginase family protein [Candidatus Kariarchaeaceae archaeon]|jgi:beta-aspartyl-peptidase (threonine type)